MKNEPNPSTADINDVQKAVKAGVQSHRIKLRLLTATTFTAGVLTLVVGLLIAWCYPYFVLPKQREMAQQAENLLKQYQAASAAAPPGDDAGKQIGKLLAVEIEVTNAITAAIAVVALAVGLLALGMLILLTMVILSRRATLNQINVSLAQISEQLRELQSVRGAL